MTTRERIKTEAMALFVERGVDAVSVRDIAQAVGMKGSNLYAHFPGRASLIGELVAEGYDAYAAALADIAGTSCLDRLDAMVRRICLLHDEDILRFRFLLLTQHGNIADGGANTPIDEVQKTIASAISANEIPPGNPALLTAMIVGVVIQVATFCLYGRLDGGMVAMADDISHACGRILAGKTGASF